MGSVDGKKLTAQVAPRHGLLIREDDPVMALVTMSEIAADAKEMRSVTSAKSRLF
jgi:hypothetical protein